jgi:hypothetical protein
LFLKFDDFLKHLLRLFLLAAPHQVLGFDLHHRDLGLELGLLILEAVYVLVKADRGLLNLNLLIGLGLSLNLLLRGWRVLSFRFAVVSAHHNTINKLCKRR